MILVDESTEDIPSLDLGEEVGLKRRRAVRDCQLEPSVWALGVVMLCVAAKDAIQMSSSENQRPVKQIPTDRSYHALGERGGLE